MIPRLPQLLVIAVLAAATAFATTMPASARDGGAKSWIKLTKLRDGVAKGKVTSGRGPCEGGDRKVSLFSYDGFLSDKLAITYTNRKGKWKLRLSLEPGRYFAKVDHSKGCRYAVSRTKRL